jgi:HKD family nuclease
MKTTFLSQPFGTKRVGDWLRDNLANPSWTRFQAAVAFAKVSGTRHVADRLADFCSKRKAILSVGIDHRGTSKEALLTLLDAMSAQALYVCHHSKPSITYHPKVYLFTDDDAASALIGSNNLTEGGLFNNYEASLAVDLNLADASDKKLYSELQDALASWAYLSSSNVKTLDKALLEKLVSIGLVPTEEQIETERKKDDSSAKKNPIVTQLLSRLMFGAPAIPPAPLISSTVRKIFGRGRAGARRRGSDG